MKALPLLVISALSSPALAQSCPMHLAEHGEPILFDGAIRYLFTADVNRDGIPDIITPTSHGSVPEANAVAVLAGRGDGTFEPTLYSPLGFGDVGRLHIALADFDRDEILDAAVAGPLSNTLYMMRGNGDGTFQAPITFPLGPEPFHIVAADLNADGLPDIVATNIDDGTISVLVNQGGLLFQDRLTYPTGLTGTSTLAVGDLNNDSHPDAVVGNAGLGSTGGAAVLLGDGNAGFGAPTLHMPEWPARSFALGDVTGDGWPDIIAGNSNYGVGLLRGNGNGTFQPPELVPFPLDEMFSYTAAIADMNDDDIPDLVNFGRNDSSDTSSGGIGVLLGSGGGDFLPMVPFGYLQVSSSAFGMAVCDFNSDGLFDVALTELQRRVQIFMNVGGGFIAVGAPPARQIVAPGAATTITVAATGPAPTYQWFFNDVPLTDSRHTNGVTSPTLHIFDCIEADAGIYSVRISGICNTQTVETYLHVGHTQPTCPTDFDGDGFVTGLDFDAFVASFEDGC